MKKRDDRFVEGVMAAAAVASNYDGASHHPFLVSDCILMKLNVVRRRKPRKNPRAENQFLSGFALALAEVSRIRGERTLVAEIAEDAGVTLMKLRAAGVEPYDADEVGKCLIARRTKRKKGA